VRAVLTPRQAAEKITRLVENTVVVVVDKIREPVVMFKDGRKVVYLPKRLIDPREIESIIETLKA